jgi:acyl-CoA thioesterase I
VPFLLEGVGGRDALMQADGIHPKREAQEILLKQVWAGLEPMLAGTAP